MGTYLNSIFSRFPEMKLVIMSTNESPVLEVDLKNWIKESSVRSFHYIRESSVDSVVIDENTTHDFNFSKMKVSCKVYNTMRKVIKSPYVWIIEPDVIPPEDALEVLSSSMTPDSVSVSAVCPHRFKKDFVNAWEDDEALLRCDSNNKKIKGNSFGCVLLKMDTVKNHVFTPDSKCNDLYKAFYKRLSDHDLIKLDWKVVCENISSVYSQEEPGDVYEFEITSSNFDTEFYLKKYPDVKKAIDEGVLISANQHYVLYGKAESKIALPLEPFNEAFYLSLYRDVKEAVNNGIYESGLEHFVRYGQAEGRRSQKLETNSTENE